MKSIHWGNPGNAKLNGKKTMLYADDVIQNLKERELLKILDKETKIILAEFSKIKHN